MTSDPNEPAELKKFLTIILVVFRDTHKTFFKYFKTLN